MKSGLDAMPLFLLDDLLLKRFQNFDLIVGGRRNQFGVTIWIHFNPLSIHLYLIFEKYSWKNPV
jgi:hypothetical protein